MALKFFLKSLVKVSIFVILMQYFIAIVFFFPAQDAIQIAFKNLCEIVASDNCLDDSVMYNGKTNYKRFFESLEAIESETKYIEFDDTSIDVQYTSRDTAPQQYSMIRTSLNGYYKFKIYAFVAMEFKVPISFELPVMGTKRYRDR